MSPIIPLPKFAVNRSGVMSHKLNFADAVTASTSDATAVDLPKISVVNIKS